MNPCIGWCHLGKIKVWCLYPSKGAVSKSVEECFLDVSSPSENHRSSNPKSRSGTSSDLESELSCSFIQWDVTAPLEVIYEGKEGENDGVSKKEEMIPEVSIVRYPSLWRYYPETDSDNEEYGIEIEFSVTGGWRFRWQDEEEKDDGLIKIEFDCEGKRVEVEDEGFIDIEFLR
ncbi:hypothetical protein Droror1_Dr00027301 [Drosera rotundifolia]